MVEEPPSKFFIAAAMLWLTIVFYTFRASSRGQRGAVYVAQVILTILGIALAFFFFFPVYAQSKGGAAIEVTRHGQIGSYEVGEAQSADAELAIAYLERMGADISPGAERVIAQYASEGWSFVVCRLIKDGVANAAPHPLKITFATRTPIYPMRLTGVTSSDMTLQLIVIGDRMAQVRGLSVWRSMEAFRPEPGSTSTWNSGGWEGTSPKSRPIGHPDFTPLLGKGDFLTYLVGRLSPSKMNSDIAISWTARKFVRAKLYSPAGRLILAAAVGLTVWSVSMFLLASFGLSKKKRESWIQSAAVGGGLAIALLVTVTFTPWVNVTEEKDRGVRPTALLSWIKGLQQKVDGLEWDGREPFRTWFHGELKNLYGGEAKAPVEKDVPGGFTISKRPDGWEVTVYDHVGTPITKRFPAAQAPG
jgi:hypothetical protein